MTIPARFSSPGPTSTPPSWPLRITLGLIGLLTMTPALALVSPGQLAGYGVMSPDAVVTTLLQHRGALQLVLGAAIIWAGFDRHVRVPILLAATLTKGVGVLLTVTRPAVFEASSGNVGLWFDMVCLVVLPAIAVVTLRRRLREHSR
ncbi:hypothetical protein [Promicromonospora sp. NPDC050249]|uniref:hypothetical protein n=1 Tax=Promicromonospora sp. NPDC050249 TaxID=3154743 RepID=UPI0033FC32DF